MATRITTAAQLAERAKNVAQNYKTLYVMGCFGAPMTDANKTRYINHHPYNAQPNRRAMIAAAPSDSFGFDCVCLIKGLLWGWNGNKAGIYGGADYGANNVPDIDADAMIGVCCEVSTDFSKIEVGEAVWMAGHIGIYIGDGLAVECTPKWDNCAQITACNRSRNGYNRRDWVKHGKLPYVTYTGKDDGQGGGSSIKVGDVVCFTGSTHYAHANAASGPACRPGEAKVTAISRGARHPYHLKAVSGAGSTVYGWVDAAAVSASSVGFKAGDRVMCKPGVGKFSNGSTMASWVPASVLYVREVKNGGKILLVSTEPVKRVYTGLVDASDVKKI